MSLWGKPVGDGNMCRMRVGKAVVGELWDRYVVAHLGYGFPLKYGDVDLTLKLRNELVISYGSLVRYVASRVATGLPPNVPRDDLVSHGTIGLMDAISRFDPSRGNEFETFAIPRIRGEIVDYLRKQDLLSRSSRAKARGLETAMTKLEEQNGRPPEDAELAEHMGISTSDLSAVRRQAAVTVISLDEHETDDRQNLRESLHDVTGNPEDIYGSNEVAELLADAVDTLPERFKKILALYYLEEMTLAGIGQVLGVTESRVCQLQSRLLETLRESLAHGFAA